MNKLILRFVLLSHIFFVSNPTFSQLFPPRNYPQNYFSWPVDTRAEIAANFGELRPNHYHMGLDARTERRENLPILAAASGYIAKVKIEPFGFGRCIYINHPNGITTLYAHLNAFYPALETYITQKQYDLQQWQVFLDLPPELFKVKKGEVIAYSGNTGGSQGPHLHFEIRDTRTDKVLNPLLFNLPIRDITPPDIIRLAIYDRCISTYEQSPKMIPLSKKGGMYQPAKGNLDVNTDKVSFAITAYDRYTGSTNQNGIYKAVVYDNGKAIAGFQMDSISYDETRFLNAHIDYRLRSKGGPYLQHLSRLPGYTNGIYSTDESNGVISLETTTPHDIRIEVSDAAGNTSTIAFKIRSGNILRSPTADPYSRKFLPGQVNVFENENIRFYLPEKSLYDSFRFRYNEIAGATGMVYQLHEPSVPLQTYFPVSIRADFDLADTSKVVMKRSFGSKDDYGKTSYNNGWYTARFREFGNFQLLIDKEPPVISTISVSGSRIIFSIKDNTEVLKKFDARIDGNWIRFSNDKGRTFIYNFDARCGPGSHTLRVRVEDQAGNVAEKSIQFNR